MIPLCSRRGFGVRRVPPTRRTRRGGGGDGWDFIGAPAVLQWPEAIARKQAAAGGDAAVQKGVPLPVFYLDDGDGDKPGVRSIDARTPEAVLAALAGGAGGAAGPVKWKVFDEEGLRFVARADGRPAYDALSELRAARQQSGPSGAAETCK